ncbi:hypothetical protein DL768_002919 [Monosporascus sp. mg162]|nr:hypothetical protein DL768_002919 [Monosporascus sp. mg162]
MAPSDILGRLENNASSVVAFACFGVFGLYALYLWLLPTPIPGIPYNAEAVRNLLGDAPNMMRSVSVTQEVMLWMAQQTKNLNAPLCQVFVRPFSKPWVLLADFREAQDVLLRRGREFDRSSFTSDLMAPAGHFHIRYKTGDQWKAARRWLQDLMTPGFLNTVAGPAIYGKALDLVSLWKEKERLAEGRPFSAALDMHHAALDAVLAFTFGEEIRHAAVAPQTDILSHIDKLGCCGNLREDEPVEFPEATLHPFIVATIEGTVILEKLINSPAPKLTLWWMSKKSWYRNIFAIKDSFIREQVGIAVERLRWQHRGGNGKNNDAATKVRSAVGHILMREQAIAEKQGRQPDFNSQQLIDEIFGNVVAGHDTTSSALGWLLKFLTDLPDIQSKLRQALHSAHPEAAAEGRPPTLAELTRNKVPYLDAVFEETLRLSAVSVTRETTCDTELLGHHIPKGTVVVFLSNGPSFYEPSFEIDDAKRSPTSRAAISRRWDENAPMQAFNPERWLKHREGDSVVEFDATAGPQLVFGLGTRSCFGKRLAYLEARIIITMVIWNFELLPVPLALRGYGATDGVTHRARQCFVRLKSIR